MFECCCESYSSIVQQYPTAVSYSSIPNRYTFNNAQTILLGFTPSDINITADITVIQVYITTVIVSYFK